jgi:primosomal protein N' (replication factor Y)
MAPRLIDVALPIPLFRTFTYSVGNEIANAIAPGTRVLVPLKTGREIGVCVGPAERAPDKVPPKPIISVPDAEPAFSPAQLAVCRWIADYYVAPLGLVLRGALPTLLTGADVPRPTERTRRVVSVRRDLPSLLQRDRMFGRARQQRALYEQVESLGGIPPAQLVQQQLD